MTSEIILRGSSTVLVAGETRQFRIVSPSSPSITRFGGVLVFGLPRRSLVCSSFCGVNAWKTTSGSTIRQNWSFGSLASGVQLSDASAEDVPLVGNFNYFNGIPGHLPRAKVRVVQDGLVYRVTVNALTLPDSITIKPGPSSSCPLTGCSVSLLGVKDDVITFNGRQYVCANDVVDLSVSYLSTLNLATNGSN